MNYILCDFTKSRLHINAKGILLINEERLLLVLLQRYVIYVKYLGKDFM